MAKKNYLSSKKMTDEIVGWKAPVFHQASECYVSLSAFDPSRGRFRVKKIMLDHVKGRRNQRLYAEALIKRLTEQLVRGWNPWIEKVQPLEYSSFPDVCRKYKEYLLKLHRENNMREETVISYTSRINVLLDWIEKKNINIYYTYQFDKHVIGQFLDYIFVDRNNTIRTRNNYLSWIKTFCGYLVQRGYVSTDPSAGFSNVRRGRDLKNRQVIPDDMLQSLHDYLTEKNRHYLLACYILHYVFVRPHEMSFLKIEDFSIAKKTLRLHGKNTKNHNDAVLTLPNQVLRLMVELDVFSSPGNYYLFSDGFRPGPVRKSEKFFRDYWHLHVRPDLGWPSCYKFYSLKDTGITNMLRANTDILSVRDQARHSSILITDIYTPKDIKDANKLLLNYHGVL